MTSETPEPRMTLAKAMNNGSNDDISEYASPTLFDGSRLDELPNQAVLDEMDLKINYLTTWLNHNGVSPDITLQYGQAFTRKMVEWGIITKDQLLHFQVEFAAWFLIELRDAQQRVQAHLDIQAAEQRKAALMNGVPLNRPFPNQGGIQ